MNSDKTAPKWTCRICTYENFPSATKCTMCQTAASPSHLRTEDIYQLKMMAPSPLPEEIITRCDSPIMSIDRWECDICQTINLSCHDICLECKTPRYEPISRDINDRLDSLKIPENEIVANIEENFQRNPEECNEVVNKWSCYKCTYQNWPKATKCIMCQAVNVACENDKTEVASDKVASPAITARITDIQNEDDVRKVKKLQKKKSDSLLAGAPLSSSNVEVAEKRSRIRKMAQSHSPDWAWLNACLGVVTGESNSVVAYLSSGGNPVRKITPADVLILRKSGNFEVGSSLIHLALRYNRETILATLLSHTEGYTSGVKRVPSYVAPDLAADIRRHFSTTIRRRQEPHIPCSFVTEQTTFFLPAEINYLPSFVREQLYQEILDQDVQRQLEGDPPPPVINWSPEVSILGSRLYALWNRTAGDCLLDSVMQATWAVFDRDNVLRSSLAESMTTCAHAFYPRWREYESMEAMGLDFSLEENQWEEDWAMLVSLASQPGASLEQLHVFVLAHILRRPILIYGVKNVKSFRGEDIGYAKFEGVYLPLLWEPSFCSKSPIALGYTRGHFCALVPMKGGGESPKVDSHRYTNVLPLVNHSMQLLPIHFVSQAESNQREILFRQWLDVREMESGMLVAQQKLYQQPLLVGQMVEEWLNYYRRLAQTSNEPFRHPISHRGFCSEGDSDDE